LEKRLNVDRKAKGEIAHFLKAVYPKRELNSCSWSLIQVIRATQMKFKHFLRRTRQRKQIMMWLWQEQERAMCSKKSKGSKDQVSKAMQTLIETTP